MEASVFASSEKILRTVAEENPLGNHGRAAEILGYFGKMEPGALKNLQSRLPFVSAILCASEIRPSLEDLLGFLINIGTLPKPASIKLLKGDWVSKMVKDEINAWQKFAGWKIDAEKYAEILKVINKEKMEILIGYGFEPGMLPNKILTEDMDIPRWVKPGSWIWQQIKAGNILVMKNGELVEVTEARLSGHPVLFDRRKKPAFNNGRQRWENDLLMEYLIEKLQQEKQLPTFDWCDLGSRFGLSRFDWAKVAPRLDEALGFPEGTFRLETWEEWSVLSQYKSGLPRTKDGQTDTWVWFDQYFKDESYSLYGGSSVVGGFADVYYDPSDERWIYHSARLLGDLGFLVS